MARTGAPWPCWVPGPCRLSGPCSPWHLLVIPSTARPHTALAPPVGHSGAIGAEDGDGAPRGAGGQRGGLGVPCPHVGQRPSRGLMSPGRAGPQVPRHGYIRAHRDGGTAAPGTETASAGTFARGGGSGEEEEEEEEEAHVVLLPPPLPPLFLRVKVPAVLMRCGAPPPRAHSSVVVVTVTAHPIPPPPLSRGRRGVAQCAVPPPPPIPGPPPSHQAQTQGGGGNNGVEQDTPNADTSPVFGEGVASVCVNAALSSRTAHLQQHRRMSPFTVPHLLLQDPDPLSHPPPVRKPSRIHFGGGQFQHAMQLV